MSSNARLNLECALLFVVLFGGGMAILWGSLFLADQAALNVATQIAKIADR